MAFGLRVLEERVLFDAAPVEEVQEAEPRESAAQSEGKPPAPSGDEIVFIDSHLSEAQGLASAALPGAEVHVLDPGADGLDQILAILSGRSGVSAVHVVSHGSAGAVEIGSAVLDDAALGARAEDLALLGRTLSEEGDLLLYGCQVGANGEGTRFADSLATLTGADVAVSTDDTGGSALGGDWELESSTGPIEARLPIDPGALDRYEGLLALTAQGSEFQINSTIPFDQSIADVAIHRSTGNFVVTWRSFEGAVTNFDIRARLFDASANPLGPDFLVNVTTTLNIQNTPSVAMDADGNFVVAFESDEGGLAFDIRARLYDAAGNPRGADFVVNSSVATTDRFPSVAMDPAGNFVIVWTQLAGADYDIMGRRFDASGNPLGADFAVSSTNANTQFFPSVAATPGGGFVAAWQSDDGGVDYDIRARRFDAAGNPLGADFLANNTTLSPQVSAGVAVGPSGETTVVWEDQGTYDIRARRFDAAGNALGNDFVVNSTTVGDQGQPAVAMNGTGTSVFTWFSAEVGAGDIRAREFDSSGAPTSDDFVVNTTTAFFQSRPDIAYADNGEIVVAWESNQSGASDIFARRYLGPAVPPASASPATEPPFDPVNILDLLRGETPHLPALAASDPGFPSWDFRLELARSPGADLSDLDPSSSTLLRELFEPAFLRKRRLAFPGLLGK
ncbi:MAG: DUF4347 domain-containing protein [Planctomycetes bacterium]|nr:DUF4347 domain-containing protein [Planctomycetota bacterium]